MSHWLLEHLQMVSFGLATVCQRLLSSSLVCIWCVCHVEMQQTDFLIIMEKLALTSLLLAYDHISAVMPQSQPPHVVNGITRTFTVRLIV